MCTEISIPSMSVDSLEGIEYFYNLKTLDCSDNELLFLDVSANTVSEISELLAQQSAQSGSLLMQKTERS